MSELHECQVPTTSSTFTSLQSTSLQDSLSQVRVTNFLYNCRLLIIYHVMEDIQQYGGLSALRNPRFLSGEHEIWLDTENTYIFVIPDRTRNGQESSKAKGAILLKEIQVT